MNNPERTMERIRKRAEEYRSALAYRRKRQKMIAATACTLGMMIVVVGVSVFTNPTLPQFEVDPSLETTSHVNSLIQTTAPTKMSLSTTHTKPLVSTATSTIVSDLALLLPTMETSTSKPFFTTVFKSSAAKTTTVISTKTTAAIELTTQTALISTTVPSSALTTEKVPVVTNSTVSPTTTMSPTLATTTCPTPGMATPPADDEGDRDLCGGILGDGSFNQTTTTTTTSVTTTSTFTTTTVTIEEPIRTLF